MARRKSTRTKTPTKTRRKPAFDADAFVRDVFANPETEVKRDDAAVNKCRQLLGHIFAIQSSAAYGEDALKLQFAPKDKKDVPLGPLTRLEVGAVFDYDQLWEELEMRNVPVYQHIMKNVREQKEVNDRPAPETESAQDEDVVTDAAGNEVVPMDGLLEREMDESSGEEDAEEENDEVGSDGNESRKKERHVHFEEDDEDDDDEDGEEDEEDLETGEKGKQSGAKKGPGSLEDGFFSLADMEAFADEAEELAMSGRLVSGGQDDEEEDSDEDDDMDLGEDVDGDKARYDQFFAPPTDEKMNEDNARALRRATLFDDASGDDEESDSEKTPLEIARAEMRGQIEAMEDAAVAKKPWVLRGEVLGSARPKNSALNEDFEHDIALQNRSAVAPPSAEEIEFTIRQRVYDGLYDDPVRVLQREYEEKKKKPELAEISQEKPTIGLGELYAEEFAAARAKVSKAAESADIEEKEEVEEETEEQKEVNRVFRRLCLKLDALSAMHFTPDMPHEIEEMEVKANVPALAAEEAIPEAVSDAALLTPGEVHKVDRKSSMGELEKKKTDRKRNRRSTKKRLRELNKERTTREKSDEQGDPLLAEKRRAERALERRGKKLKQDPTSDIKKGQFSKSNRFFESLQNDAGAEIRAKQSAMRDQAKEDKGSSSAAQLKL